MANIINGTADHDTLPGTAADDSIVAIEGNDSLDGAAGNDTLLGGAGYDTLIGDTGNDVIDGGADIDTVVFNGWNWMYSVQLDAAGTLIVTDTISGDGADTLTHVEKLVFDDVTMIQVAPGAGNDTVSGTWVYGGDGDDSLSASTPWTGVILDGGAGADTLRGSYTGRDILNGGDGNDIIQVSGSDLVSGGAGDDLFDMSLSDSPATVTGGEGRDTYRAGSASGAVDGIILNGEKLITDFTPGDSGDVIDVANLLWSLRDYDGRGLASTSIRLIQDGGDVLFQIDPDVAGVRPWETALRLKDVALSALTAENLSGYDPAGATVAPLTQTGSGGTDYMHGGLGNDSFDGGGGADYLSGADGADSLVGGDGDDTLSGGFGPDTVIGGAGNDYVFEGFGRNLVDGGDGDDNLGVSGAAVTVTGGAGDDTIEAQGETYNLIDAGAGDDVVGVLTAPGQVTLGDGQDILISRSFFWAGTAPVITDFTVGEGGDTLHISNPATFFSNYSGGDPFASGHYAWVQDGADAVLMRDYDGAGADDGVVTQVVRLRDVTAGDLTWFNVSSFVGATASADNIIGLSWGDSISAMDGNDWVRGLDGHDSIDGEGGNDTLDGGINDDVLMGGAGDDALIGGAGNDTLNGGAGVDTAIFKGARADYALGLDGLGNLTVTDTAGRGGTDVLIGVDAIQFADITLTRQELTTGPDNAAGAWVSGGLGSDGLTAVSGTPSILDGGAGDDRLYGEQGANILIGGDGNDRLYTHLQNSTATMSGGNGTDTYAFNSALAPRDFGPVIGGEKVITDFAAGDGGDVIELRILLRVLTDYNGDGFASGSLRVIQDGNDALIQVEPDGGIGARSWETVYRLKDVSAGDLTAYNFGGYDPTGAAAPTVTWTGDTGADYHVGGIGHDTLIGADGDDILAGKDGRDSIDGGAGNDQLDGDTGNDTVSGGDGNDDIRERGGSDILDGGAGDDLIDAYDDYATVTGGDGNDIIYAWMRGSGSVDAGAGNDLVVADPAQATVTLGEGRDVLNLYGWFRDSVAVTVTDFVAGDGGDILQLPYLGDHLTNYSGGDPFASGHFRWVQDHANAVLERDLDGSGTGFAPVLILQNVDIDDLTAQNVASVAATSGDDILIGDDYYADSIDGGDGNDWISGFDGLDPIWGEPLVETLSGGAGDDTITGGRGSDLIDGGDGDDTAIFSGNRAEYTITTIDGSTTISGANGVDTLSGIETLVFDDVTETSNAEPVLTGDLAATVAFGGAYVLTAADIGFTDADDTEVFFDVSNVRGGGIFVDGEQSDWFSNDELTAGLVSFRHGGYSADAAGFDVTVTDETATSAKGVFAVTVDNSVGRLVVGHEAGDIEVISKNAAGEAADDATGSYMGSADGRYVIFSGYATNLVFDGQNDGDQHVYRKDLVTGNVVRVDTAADGELADFGSWSIDVSADGNLVLFGSAAGNLDDSGLTTTRVFMKNIATGEVTPLVDGGLPEGAKLPNGGTLAMGFSGGFAEAANEVVFGAWSYDASTPLDFMELLYTRSLSDGTVEQLSDFNAPGNWTFYQASLGDVTSDGSKVLFFSNAPYLVPDDVNGEYDLFVLDTATRAISVVNAPASGVPAGGVLNEVAHLSPDGTKVVFGSSADGLMAADNHGAVQVFVKDLTTGAVTLLSANAGGEAGNDDSSGPVVSADGRTVYFSSYADNLVAGDDNGVADIFAYDLQSGSLSRIVAGDGDAEWVTALTPDRVMFNAVTEDPGSLGYGLEVRMLHQTGADGLVGGDGNDTLRGLGGNDTLDGGLGSDRMYGGTGNDTYYVSQSGDNIYENANEGFDTVVSAIGWKAGASIEAIVLTGSANVAAYGNALANVLTGNGGNNTLSGADGNDTLWGQDGNDKLDGGNDHDVASGGAGNDSLNGGEGSDSLDGGTGNDQLNGGARWDTLRGGDGDDIIDGGTENDAMYGGAGNDVFYVDHTGDRVYENYGEGTDTVKASISYALTPDVETLYLTGTANISGTGNGLHNAINGNSGNNALSGGLGNDSLYGWDGNDSLTGGADHDRLSGGNGNDTLIGGSGNDIVGGGAGADDFVFASIAVNGHDHLSDFQHGLDRLVFAGADYGFTAGHVLSSAEFTLGSAAVGATAQFVFDGNKLWWDADGSGAGAAFELAIVSGDDVTKDDLFFT